MMKSKYCLFITALIVLLFCGNALAHKVSIFAYVEAGTIYTESYFSDGTAVQDGKVLVYDSHNAKLLEGKTDKEGHFDFAVPAVDDLTIVIEATMGHKNSFKLKKAEVEAGR
jgi:nickel transport protein